MGYAGKQLKNVLKQKPDYWQWMLGSDFPEETKKVVIDALNGKSP
jgi:hypothetical protein